MMGAKASTPNGEDAGSRERTFSTGSASDIVAGTGFNILRSFPSLGITDRQRARSLSSVPDSHENNSIGDAEQANGQCDLAILENENTSEDPLDSPLGASIGLSLGLGRVYTARSLPSHIWSLNGMYDIILSSKILWLTDIISRSRNWKKCHDVILRLNIEIRGTRNFTPFPYSRNE